MDNPYPQPLPPTPTHAPGLVSSQKTFYCSSCGNHLGASQIGGNCSSCGTPVSRSLERNNLPTPGSATASMVLGIVSLVTCLFYGVPGLICGILAIIFAGKADRMIQTGAYGNQSRGMITAGRVCGWIGISLGSLYTLVVIGYFFLFAMLFSSAVNNPNWMTPPPQGHQYNTPQQVVPNSQLSPTPGALSIGGAVEEESSEDPPAPNPRATELEDTPPQPEANDGPSP